MMNSGSDNNEHRSRARFRCPGSGTDMTPMVDVTFLLLIFFMVTASFTLQRAIAMPGQDSDQSSRRFVDLSQQVVVSLSVDRLGGFYLLTASGEQSLAGKQSLVTALKRAWQASTHARLEIAVEPEARLQAMVDAIDAGTIAGFSKITVIQSNSEQS